MHTAKRQSFAVILLALSALFCAALLCCPAPASAASSNLPSPIDMSSHTHKSLKIPVESHLRTAETTEKKATYYYACTCGKEYSDYYSYGSKFRLQMSARLKELSKMYKNNSKGGVVLAGSSYLRRWFNASDDFYSTYGYSKKKVANFAIARLNTEFWTSDKYISAITAKKPAVIIFSSTNRLRHYKEGNNSANSESVDILLVAMKEFAEKVHKKLPNTKIVFIASVKSPYEYIASNDSYCSNWKRTDSFNKRLEAYAKKVNFIECVSIEDYYLYAKKTASGKVVYYYTGELFDKKSAKTTAQIAKAYKKGNRIDPYFAKDLLHPSALAFTEILTPTVGKKALELAGFLKDEPEPTPEPDPETPEDTTPGADSAPTEETA